MLIPALGRGHQDPRRAVGSLAVGLSLWLAATALPGLGPEPPPPHVLADHLVADPDALRTLTVEYLDVSWRDTEGTIHTITGLPAMVHAAASTGARGKAARRALDRVDHALALVDERDPAVASDLREVAASYGLPGGARGTGR